MKKITLLLLLFSSIGFAQDLKFLDDNNGYKKFKFGSKPEQISNIEKPYDWNSKFYTSQNILPYEYVGNDLATFFNVDIFNIDLWFHKNQLFGIGFSLGDRTNDFTDREFEQLKNYLAEIFGNDYHNAKSAPGLVKGYIWKGNKVTLELNLANHDFDLPKSERRPISCFVYMYSNSLNLEMKKSQL